jgi:hypothetical protein
VLNWRWSAAAGIVLAATYAASPLFVAALALAGVLLVFAGRDLPAHERRTLIVILAAALAVRFLLIGALLITNIPYLSDLGVGGLRGDDAYYLARATRARDIMLNVTHGRYDYFVVSDEYGRTSYLQFLTLIQLLFGPAPYGVRALNALLFVTGGYWLYKLCRPGLGATASSLALIALLFLPSLLVSSISTAKEPSYFLVTTVLLVSAIAVIRDPSTSGKIFAIVVAAISLWILDDLRRGALVLGLAGLALAAAARLLLATPRRALTAVAVAAIVAIALWMQSPVRERFMEATTTAAKMHAGHVFTPGHAYKLLDDGFYMHPGAPAAWLLQLTEVQAWRFLVRAATSFVVTPWPWEMTSRSELLFLPEHIFWLMMMACVPIGVVAGWRRDATITACLIGFALPTAAVLAVTTGNVGTLLRLRGLVTPYLVWFGVLGALTVCERLLARTRATAVRPAEALS